MAGRFEKMKALAVENIFCQHNWNQNRQKVKLDLRIKIVCKQENQLKEKKLFEKFHGNSWLA